jgi:hypothetical protein
MATVTLRQVIDEAAKRLGELATGQQLNADQLTEYRNNASYLLEQLSDDGIVTIVDEDEIPASWAPYLATLLGNLAGPGVGVPFSLEAKQQTEAVLRKLIRGTVTFEKQTPDYF